MYCCNLKGCKKRFTTKFSLRRHQLIHKKLKVFKCGYCKKGFVLKQYLDEHVHIHTGAKPYICPIPGCGLAFRQAGKLSIHKKSHANESAEVRLGKMIDRYQYPDWFTNKILPLPIDNSGRIVQVAPLKKID